MVYDARYWREQAVLCLQIARELSDRQAADEMRATATEYFARATELEKRVDTVGQQAGRPDTASDQR